MSTNEHFLRNVIGNYMLKLGKKDERVVIVNADLAGTCRNKDFGTNFPNRSFNVGIAEQNMVSFAAGLAHEGFIPYTFSMAPFLSMRACEQCRTDVAYENLKVRLMATYAGLSGGISGATHWSIEDCGIMCSIPNMTVIELSDPIQAIRLLDASINYAHPMYIRSTVEPVHQIYPDDYQITIGKADYLKVGTDATIIACGLTVHFALAASEQLLKDGINVGVIDLHTIKPIDREAIRKAAMTKNILVVQDHNKYGGLGQQVAMVIAEESLNVKFKILGITDQFVPMAHPNFLYHKFGFDQEGIEKGIRSLLS